MEVSLSHQTCEHLYYILFLFFHYYIHFLSLIKQAALLVILQIQICFLLFLSFQNLQENEFALLLNLCLPTYIVFLYILVLFLPICRLLCLLHFLLFASKNSHSISSWLDILELSCLYFYFSLLDQTQANSFLLYHFFLLFFHKIYIFLQIYNFVLYKAG